MELIISGGKGENQFCKKKKKPTLFAFDTRYDPLVPSREGAEVTDTKKSVQDWP